MAWKWHYGDVEVDGSVDIDLNEYVDEYKDDIFKLLSDDDIKKELNLRVEGKSKQELYLPSLDIRDAMSVSVDVSDVLEEVEDTELLDEVIDRGLNTVEFIEAPKEELRKFICQTLDINELYTDEEIFELLKEIWKIR